MTQIPDTKACVFCQIVAGAEPANIVRRWKDTIAIVPLSPVVDGHLLVIPNRHVADFTTSLHVSGTTMVCAAQLAGQLDKPMNLITSKGSEATQTVWHLHIHLVPRAAGDRLALPWG